MSLVPVVEYASADALRADTLARNMRLYPERFRPHLVQVVAINPPPAPKRASTTVGTRWSKSEDKELRALASKGIPRRTIAEKLNRSVGGIEYRAEMLRIKFAKVVLPADRVKEAAKDFAGVYRLAFSCIPASVPSHGRSKWIAIQCAEAHGLTFADIVSDSRASALIRARQQAMWLVAKHTTLSLPAIGLVFRRDHTTILHAIRRENGRTGENVRGCGNEEKKRAQNAKWCAEHRGKA